MTTKEIKTILNGYTKAKQAFAFYSNALRDPGSDADLMARLDAEQENICRYEKIVCMMFSCVSNDIHAQMLADHYIDGLLWRQISDKYHYSDTSMYNTQNRALMEIAKKMPDTPAVNDSIRMLCDRIA